MRKFLLDIIVVIISTCFLFLLICIFIDSIGWTDWAYKKLISEGNCKSMITGTSRAEQGIVPSVVDSFFNLKGAGCPIQNFAFTGESSPYGEVYYNAINRKINHQSNNGLFLVSVDPWSLTVNTTSDAAGSGYREDFQVLGKVKSFYKPNIGYYWHYLGPSMCKPHLKLHDDGWLEISVSMDEKDVIKRKDTKKKDYNSDLKYYKSEYRINWLKNTIALLKKHGRVVMFRIPADDFIIEIENKIWPNFDAEMYDIANNYSIQYISFHDKTNYYKTTDGNHLYKDDARRFTKELCDSIKTTKNFQSLP